MKQYVIDELRPEDYDKLQTFLENKYGKAKFDGIFWIPIDPSLLEGEQLNHQECQPFFFIANLEPNILSFELLVRTKNRIRCQCITYATEKQRNWLIQTADEIFDELEIIS